MCIQVNGPIRVGALHAATRPYENLYWCTAASQSLAKVQGSNAMHGGADRISDLQYQSSLAIAQAAQGPYKNRVAMLL